MTERRFPFEAEQLFNALISDAESDTQPARRERGNDLGLLSHCDGWRGQVGRMEAPSFTLRVRIAAAAKTVSASRPAPAVVSQTAGTPASSASTI